jgi:uncharacterized protein YciU (UPF0263 family)
MIKLPKYKNIFGEKIKYNYAPLRATMNAAGLYDKKTGAILIDPDQSDDEIQVSIFHEEFHSVLDITRIGEAVTPEVEEIIVDCFAKFLVKHYKVKAK